MYETKSLLTKHENGNPANSVWVSCYPKLKKCASMLNKSWPGQGEQFMLYGMN